MIMSRNGTGNLFSGIRIRARVGRGLSPAIGKAALRMTGQIPALPEICGSNKHRKEPDYVFIRLCLGEDSKQS